MKRRELNIIEAMSDPALFGSFFKRRLIRGDTWATWKIFLRGLFGLPMSESEKEIFRKHTGRDPREEAFREAYVIVGRRGGKSLIAALIATFLAAFKTYDDVLAPGETGVLAIIAADRRQARVILGYINAFFASPLLRSMVQEQLKESLTLTNRVRIEIHTCSFKATRGYTLIGVIADEVAFWASDVSANPDFEVLNALRPGLATTNGLLLCISSPYSKRGALYQAYRDHFGKPSEVLVWKAASREMNPRLSAVTVELAYISDPASARSEYGGEFRDDVQAFISIELVESRVIPGRVELPPKTGRQYVGFCDPSGGRGDSMCLAIAHVNHKQMAVLDFAIEVQPPFSPESVAADFSDLLKRYRISEVTGDAYGGDWPREQFSKRGIAYRVSDKSKSELYLEALPIFTSGRVEILDNRRIVTQFANLERRTARSGRDSVDHPANGHDDLCNAVAGALGCAAKAATSADNCLAVLKTPGGLLDFGRGPAGTAAPIIRPTTRLALLPPDHPSFWRKRGSL